VKERTQRPGRDEHAEYFRKYVDAVPDGDVIEAFAAHGRTLAARLRSLPADRGAYRYAPGKWTVGEVLGHLIDTERVFAYRAIHIARGDGAPLPAMDQDAWALGSNAAARPLPDLVAEFEAVRASTLALYHGLDGAAWDRRGLSSGVPISVRALAWIAAGHGMHHDGVLVKAYGIPLRRSS